MRFRGQQKRDPMDSIVLIHDGVRPVVEYEVISENIASVKRYGSAITSTQCYETILVSHDGCSVDDLPLRKERLLRTGAAELLSEGHYGGT